jgi:hypothetical protein
MEITENNVNELLKDISEKYLPEEVVLNNYGLILKKHVDKYIGYNNFNGESSIQQLNMLMKEIPKYFQKNNSLRKKYWNTGSYGAKHKLANLIEREYKDNYVTNGQFIFAMLLLGYEMKPISFEKKHITCCSQKDYLITEISPNATFNSSIRDLSKVDCECGLQFARASKKQHERSKMHQLIMSKKIN